MMFKAPSFPAAIESLQPAPVLFIGAVDDAAASRAYLAPGAEHCSIQLHQLTPEFLALLQPAVVLSPLFDLEIDPGEVAELLQALGYRGRYCAVTKSVPKPDVIRRDINRIAPELDFDVIMLDEAPPALH
ncbi:MAG: hypothetical protein AAFQ54_13575 [Pseudomonadota bacterium]